MSTALELRFQLAVIALAEELSYTRAADRLHISQPALTKQIHELKRILRLNLFDRNKKNGHTHRGRSRLCGRSAACHHARRTGGPFRASG